jgi:hypothetical protein
MKCAGTGLMDKLREGARMSDTVLARARRPQHRPTISTSPMVRHSDVALQREDMTEVCFRVVCRSVLAVWV